MVHLMDSSERFYTMVVQPLTGEVEIYDGYIDLIDVQQTQGPFGEQ
ncbi:MAG: hypothetical protein M5R36_09260 [Deltaproteobacteria bacterium]|nr:hypothetical protein [Deltaproteobacteria bacterium]